MNPSDFNNLDFNNLSFFGIVQVIQETTYLQLYQKETNFTLLNCKIMMDNINNPTLFKSEITGLNTFIEFCLKMINPTTENEKYKQSILLGTVKNFNENLFNDSYFFNLYLQCHYSI